MLERRHAHTQVSASVDASASLSPDAVAVRRALATLRPRHRAAVFLRFYLDLSEQEIAEVLTRCS